MSQVPTQPLSVRVQALERAITILSTSTPDPTWANHVLEQWLQLARQTVLIADLDTLKLLLSLLRNVSSQHPNWQIHLFQYAGHMAAIKGLYKQAEGFFEKQLSLTLERKNPTDIIEAQINLAEILIAQGQTDRAEKLLKEAIESSQKNRLYLPYVRSLNRMGGLYCQQRKWKNSQRCFALELTTLQTLPERETLDAFSRTLLELENAYTCHWLGVIQANNRRWEEATDFLEESLKIRQKHGSLAGVAESLLKLGEVYQQSGDWDTAISYLERSLDTCQQIRNLTLSLQALCLQAVSYYRLGKHWKGFIAARRAVAIGLKAEEQDWLARSYYILGQLQNKLGDSKAALNNLARFAKAFPRHDNNPNWIEPLIEVGDFLLSLPDNPSLWEQALECYTRAADLIELNQQLEYLAPALGKMARAFLKVKGLEGLDEAARCYRLELQLAGDLESVVLPVAVAVALRVEALTGIQSCAALRKNRNTFIPVTGAGHSHIRVFPF